MNPHENHSDDGLLHARICRGKIYSYSVCENGTVIRTSNKRHIESFVKPYLKRGKAAVKINGREHTLKNLVARYFVEGYIPGCNVEVLDDNPFNCSAKNLRPYTRNSHGRRTGYRSRSQKVIANGVEYRSIRNAAKALHCSYQTVLDYLNGKPKNSVLSGVNIMRVATSCQNK